MNYRRFQPSLSVSRFVEFYWTLEDVSPGSSVQRIVPDGRPGIILNFGRPYESEKDGAWKLQPECFFIGQITGPLLLRASGAASMLGIQFRPHGAAQFLRMSMPELTNSAILIEDLSRDLSRGLGPLRDLSSPAARIAALDSMLSGLAEVAPAGNDPVAYAVEHLERTRGQIGIRSLADRIGWSSRQFQRRFKASVGISPRLFGRMQRFQGVFHAIEGFSSGWVNAAVDCGYFDQAHLIRDCREFSGKTPGALLNQEIDLTRHFVQPRAVSHFSKTLAEQSR